MVLGSFLTFFLIMAQNAGFIETTKNCKFHKKTKQARQA